jgi:RNA-directed DNA polymerase
MWTCGFEFLGCEISSKHIRPSSTNRKELLSKIRQLFGESLQLSRKPQSAFKNHASYSETIYLASKTVQGWANTFGFCTDERIMNGLDKEISILMKRYSYAIRKRIRNLSDVDQRRVLGLFSMADRVQPMAKDLVRSLQ